MKTTLVIEDGIMARLRSEAARQNRTMSELVEAALRLLLDRKPKAESLPELPTFHGGGLLVDIANREALDEALGDD
jgi:hypothetical protein